ncbi:prepilin-type N-terminal cleavage/methylation domain-containing protein [Paucibacter soli]|uniref:prepilin-type N-terminal cleavage/methylation domain-containing protein n=1 Tax=Paucibacter soli TaxID=3133433 RepID=UPI0030978F36
MNRSIKSRIYGFTLVELMVVLAISGMIAVYVAQRAREAAEDRLTASSADNAIMLGKALAIHMSNNTAVLAGAAATLPTVADLQLPNSCGPGASCLASTFQPSSWMGGWTMKITRIGAGSPYQFEALACTNNPWTVNGTTRIDLVGSTVKKIGGLGGMTYDATGAVGNGGSWAGSVAAYPFANVAGKLCYFVSQSLTALDSLYLRTDGTNKMNAALQMNGNDIQSAKDITATGIVDANAMKSATSVDAATMTATGLVKGATLTSDGDINVGAGSSIKSTGAMSIQAGGNLILQPQDNGAGSKTVVGGSGGSGSLEAITITATDKMTATNDVEITSLTSRPSAPTTVSVKSLLPSLVEVNSHTLTADGQSIPAAVCPAGSSGSRVFIIPQQARGTVTGTALWGSTMYASGPLGGPWTLYAKDANGASMTVSGGAPFLALARVFCAF